MQSAGIVLRVIPQKHKIVVLDRDLGVIDALSDLSLKVKRLCNGAHIVYNPQQHRNTYLLANVDFIGVPFDWARQDILFLHHVLELAFYFLPPKSPHQEIFYLIISLYAADERCTSFFKKTFLVRFFLALGIYPDDEELLKQVQIIIEKPIDGTRQEDLHLDAQRIDAWLLSCMRMHPYRELFKTSHFITHAIGSHEEI